MSLNIEFPPDMPRKEVDVHVQAGTSPYGDEGPKLTEPLPSFSAIRPGSRYAARGQHKPDSVRWLFECSNLDAETGRCGDYENRPELCRIFEAKSDPLCVHYEGSWRGWLRLYAEPAKAVTAPVDGEDID